MQFENADAPRGPMSTESSWAHYTTQERVYTYTYIYYIAYTPYITNIAYIADIAYPRSVWGYSKFPEHLMSTTFIYGCC